MKHTGYTPGPWMFVSGTQRVGSGSWGCVADIAGTVASPEMRAANGRLIADAPRLAEENERLREALLKANAYLEQLSYSGGNALLPEIRAALDRTRSAEGIAGREGESK